jgi:hypothetical protein
MMQAKFFTNSRGAGGFNRYQKLVRHLSLSAPE